MEWLRKWASCGARERWAAAPVASLSLAKGTPFTAGLARNGFVDAEDGADEDGVDQLLVVAHGLVTSVPFRSLPLWGFTCEEAFTDWLPGLLKICVGLCWNEAPVLITPEEGQWRDWSVL